MNTQDWLMKEAERREMRYAGHVDFESALAAALRELQDAADYPRRPTDGRPTKMEAMEFLRFVAMALPERIDPAVVGRMIEQFPDGNVASKELVIEVLALSHHTETVPFLKGLMCGMIDANDRFYRMAAEAIDILEDRRKVGWINSKRRLIYRTIGSKRP